MGRVSDVAKINYWKQELSEISAQQATNTSGYLCVEYNRIEYIYRVFTVYLSRMGEIRIMTAACSAEGRKR